MGGGRGGCERERGRIEWYSVREQSAFNHRRTFLTHLHVYHVVVENNDKAIPHSRPLRRCCYCYCQGLTFASAWLSMEFDAFGFYDFFFLFNSLRETFERVSNTNCVPMFLIFPVLFFIFTDEAIRQRSVRIRIEELFFSHGSSKFFSFFFLYKVCTKSYECQDFAKTI